MTYWADSRWFESLESGCIIMTRPGVREIGEDRKPEDYAIRIPLQDIPKLVAFLEGQGYLKPRLDERLRMEDLKITHRLIDLLNETLSRPRGKT
jgi:hypothetical protein